MSADPNVDWPRCFALLLGAEWRAGASQAAPSSNAAAAAEPPCTPPPGPAKPSSGPRLVVPEVSAPEAEAEADRGGTDGGALDLGSGMPDLGSGAASSSSTLSCAWKPEEPWLCQAVASPPPASSLEGSPASDSKSDLGWGGLPCVAGQVR